MCSQPDNAQGIDAIERSYATHRADVVKLVTRLEATLNAANGDSTEQGQKMREALKTMMRGLASSLWHGQNPLD